MILANDRGVTLRDDLLAVAERRRKAEDELARVTAEQRELIREAHEIGVPVAEIARLVGWTRKSVYRAISD